jgi:hypothetical protein
MNVTERECGPVLTRRYIFLTLRVALFERNSNFTAKDLTNWSDLRSKSHKGVQLTIVLYFFWRIQVLMVHYEKSVAGKPSFSRFSDKHK